MKIHESECVALKRRGAEYIAQLLLGKSKNEKLKFWSERTKRLRSQQKHENLTIKQKCIN